MNFLIKKPKWTEEKNAKLEFWTHGYRFNYEPENEQKVSNCTLDARVLFYLRAQNE